MSRAADPLQLSAADQERLQVRSRAEIVAILRELVERRAPVSVHFSQGSDFIASTLLAVNPEFEELVFDCSGDAQANARLLASPRLQLVSSLDRVRIQFGAEHAQAVSHEGLPAIRARIPDRLVRVQRRDYFRIAPPRARELRCLLQDPRAERGVELRILDISCGGIAVLDGPERLPLEPGLILEDCSIALPGGETLRFRAEVRSATPSGAGMRCGLQFIDLPPRTIAAIQRYILGLDRERRARGLG